MRRISANKKGLKYSFNLVDCILLLTLYSSYSVCFALLQSGFLCMANITGFLITVLCFYLVRKKMAAIGGFLSVFALLVICSVHIAQLGWESGFQYYFLSLCPLIFLSGISNMKFKISVCMLFALLFVLFSQLSQGSEPVTVLTSQTLGIMAKANIIFIFASLSAVIFHYSRLANKYEYTLHATNSELSLMASTDQLTGLYNRRYILNAIEQEMAMYEIKHKPFTVAIADVDNFKSINDNYGHNEGDRALVLISRCMKSVLRKEDIVARWGGEEFIFLLPQTSLAQSLIAMEKVRNSIAQLNKIYQKSYVLTVTIGVSTYTGRQKIRDLVKHADVNLYAGKQSGKNKVVA